MRTIEISNNQLNKFIDAINGACIALGHVLEQEHYSKDEYSEAISKLGTRVNDFLKVCKIDHDNTMKSYIISCLETMTMRKVHDKKENKDSVKVTSGAGFRKKFRVEIMGKFSIKFKPISDGKTNKAKKVNVKELEAKIKELEAKLAAK